MIDRSTILCKPQGASDQVLRSHLALEAPGNFVEVLDNSRLLTANSAFFSGTSGAFDSVDLNGSIERWFD